MISLEVWSEGTKWWCKNENTTHRANGPAVCWSDGGCEWMVNGIYHRADGPAVVYSDGTIHWYWNDLHITEFEHMMLSEQEQVNGHLSNMV